MNEYQDRMVELQDSIEAGMHFAKQDKLEPGYVADIIVPKLKEAVIDKCRDIERHHLLDGAEEQEKRLVIHYTSIGTLFSMLQGAVNGQTASLRMYDSVHFNDPEEGKHLISVLAEHHTWLKKGREHSSHAYIASFINDGREMCDDLTSWRSYGRDGEGCSLLLSVWNSRLRKVIYGVDEAECAVQALLPVLDELKPLANVSHDFGETLAKAFRESLEGIQYLYKSEAYRNENECRFIMHQSEVSESRICVEFRDGSPLTVRHYCEHDDLRIWEIFGSGSLITIGPCVPNYDDLNRVLNILIERTNQKISQRTKLLRPEICPSQISYRRT